MSGSERRVLALTVPVYSTFVLLGITSDELIVKFEVHEQKNFTIFLSR